MRRLDGKVALISGTARGQGRVAARRFETEGATVSGGDLADHSLDVTDEAGGGTVIRVIDFEPGAPRERGLDALR